MGCVYTGSAGGANATDTANCANEAAGMATIRSASNNQRIVRILITFPDQSFVCPVLCCCCGLRGLKGTISERNVLKTPSRSQMVPTQTFSFRRCRSLFKKAQVEHASHQFSVVERG